jgi:hypothetical protein
MTAANADPELNPNTATSTAMASSKLLLDAVKAFSDVGASANNRLVLKISCSQKRNQKG